MKAMLLERLGPLRAGSQPLRLVDLPEPAPGDGEVLIAVDVCGVCHTELDEIEGRAPPRMPMVLGHQVVGRVVARGANVTQWAAGDRVGVAWIGSACGNCPQCRAGRENLCPAFQATGRDRFGGYAERLTAPADFVFRIPEGIADEHAAPLLCAGAIGYRSFTLTGLVDGQSLGLTGFGASAQLVLAIARHQMPRSKVYVFARSVAQRQSALAAGAAWAGEITAPAPLPLDAMIDTTPAWLPVVRALENLAPGGRLVINALRKEDDDRWELLGLDYARHLWLEKQVRSVANVTRRDVREFLTLAEAAALKPAIRTFALAEANEALVELKLQSVPGAKVLRVRPPAGSFPLATLPGS